MQYITTLNEQAAYCRGYGVSSSACYTNGTSALPCLFTPSPFGLADGSIYVPKEDVLTDVQKRAFLRTMQKHKDGLDLLAE